MILVGTDHVRCHHNKIRRQCRKKSLTRLQWLVCFLNRQCLNWIGRKGYGLRANEEWVEGRVGQIRGARTEKDGFGGHQDIAPKKEGCCEKIMGAFSWVSLYDISIYRHLLCLEEHHLCVNTISIHNNLYCLPKLRYCTLTSSMSTILLLSDAVQGGTTQLHRVHGIPWMWAMSSSFQWRGFLLFFFFKCVAYFFQAFNWWAANHIP